MCNLGVVLIAGFGGKNFQLFNGEEMTTIFYLKTCTNCHGVVFSYILPGSPPFSIDYTGAGLVLSYGPKMSYPTGIKLKDNVWHMLALTYSLRLKEVQLVVFFQDRAPTPDVFKINPFQKQPFKAGGILSLGKFQISSVVPKWQKPDKFVGCYDSLGFAFV